MRAGRSLNLRQPSSQISSVRDREGSKCNLHTLWLLKTMAIAFAIEVSESRSLGNPAECRELFCMCLLHPGCAFTVNAHHKTVTQLSKDGQIDK